MADDYKNRNDLKTSFAAKDKRTKSEKKLHSIGNDRVHVIITQRKQNSWVNDLDEREKLSKIQRIFH